VAVLGTFVGASGPVLAAATSAAPLPASAPANAHGAQWQTIQDYCFKCHNTEDWAGSLAFDTMSADDVPQDSKVWEATIKKLRSGLMPPPTEEQPDHAAVLGMVSWLETTLDKAQEAAPYAGYVPPSPQPPQYANAVATCCCRSTRPPGCHRTSSRTTSTPTPNCCR
jgi:hypothetical protein